MSFKEFSSAQGASGKVEPSDKSKSKAAPAADQPGAQPGKTLAEVAPAPKL